jgi:hypothetical protein
VRNGRRWQGKPHKIKHLPYTKKYLKLSIFYRESPATFYTGTTHISVQLPLLLQTSIDSIGRS